jgi:hypothetical protein
MPNSTNMWMFQVNGYYMIYRSDNPGLTYYKKHWQSGSEGFEPKGFCVSSNGEAVVMMNKEKTGALRNFFASFRMNNFSSEITNCKLGNELTTPYTCLKCATPHRIEHTGQACTMICANSNLNNDMCNIPCPPDCNACSGGICSACGGGKYLDLQANACITTCPFGYYGESSNF